MEPAPLDKEEDVPESFDPRDEYRTLLNLAEAAAASPPALFPPGGAEKDVYQQLVSKERRVLDTVDRVINDAAEREARQTLLHKMPVHEVIMRTLGSLRALWDDLMSVEEPMDVVVALADPARRPFLGIFLIAVAIILAFVHIAA
jgi:hypothetical protein